MSTLKDKAEQILQEKEEKVIPENLPDSVTVYGVSGGVIDVRSLSNDISQEGAQLVKHIEPSTGEEWYAAEVTGLGSYDDGNGVIVGTNNLIQLPLDIPEMANVIGLTANKIKQGETILGITGTYGGSGSNDVYSLGTNSVQEYDEETGDMIYSMSYYWLEKNNIQVSMHQIEIDDMTVNNYELISRWYI